MAKEMTIENSVVVNKPVSQVYEYLRMVKNQENFSVWNMADPNKKTVGNGTDGSEGFVYSWDSQIKNVGAGSQEIKKLVQDKSIDYEIRFERPMQNIAFSSFNLVSAGDGQTRVTWDFRSPTKFPMSLFSWIFKRMLSKNMSESLANLKAILDK